MKVFAFVVACLSLLLTPALAQTKLTGTFTANQACPALQSIKKASNPGNVTLTAGTGYKLLGGNTAQPTYYWIVVPDASPDYRWVAATCGTADATAIATSTTSPSKSAGPQYILALSWEPAFCAGQSSKPECKAETPTTYDATHISLHGLWPEPRSKAYCGADPKDEASDKAHDWAALPAVQLSAGTKSALDQAMPGTLSMLERHEWIVHGTCSGVAADPYFARAASFNAAVAASAVNALFASHVGQDLQTADIRAAFDSVFGKGAGDRVRISCDKAGGKTVISEMTIGLSGDVTGSASLADLIAAAPATDAGCPGGTVEAVAGHS